MVFLFLFFLLPIGAEDRKIDVGPQYLFEGSTIFFEVKGLQGRSQDLNWDFGDGTVKRGGRKAAHVYRRSGGFTVRVYERTDPKNPVEIRIRILKDNRRIVLPHETLIKGAPAKIEVQQFIDNSIWWDFGDGSPEQRGGRSMTHTYTRTGTFKIRAVDFGGDDTKKIVKKIRVREDNRSLVLPGEILEGEPVDITMRNGEGGHFIWEFSDGKTQTGTSIKSMTFKRAGPVTITINDKTGKFPPLTKEINVTPDNRQLKAETSFALPNEKPWVFDFLNFQKQKDQMGFWRWDGEAKMRLPV